MFLLRPQVFQLDSLLTSYIWETLDVGYIQGMCDLIAPFLVLFDDGNIRSNETK